MTDPDSYYDDILAKYEPTKEQKAKFAAELAEQRKELEKLAKVQSCRRCDEPTVFEKIDSVTLTEPGPMECPAFWLCKSCSTLFHRFIGELSEAKREARKPFTEADIAVRRAEADKVRNEARAKLNAEREAKGLPPLTFGASKSKVKAAAGPKKPRSIRKSLEG